MIENVKGTKKSYQVSQVGFAGKNTEIDSVIYQHLWKGEAGSNI